MEDLRWACTTVNLRQVRSSLAQASSTRPTRGGSGEPAAKRLRTSSASPPPDSASASSPRGTLDISAPDPLAGSTVLHFACNPAVGTQPRAHLPVLRLLLNHGAADFIDKQNDVGDTPLIVAARQGDSGGSQLLLKADADPSVKNRFGDTALHVACRLGHAELVSLLLEWKGCDTRAKNCLGKTAAMIANHRVRDLVLAADGGAGAGEGDGVASDPQASLRPVSAPPASSAKHQPPQRQQPASAGRVGPTGRSWTTEQVRGDHLLAHTRINSSSCGQRQQSLLTARLPCRFRFAGQRAAGRGCQARRG
jgi:hypothetical protein